MKNSLLKTCFVALLAVLGWGNAWADNWTRCKAVSDLTSGGTFIIGYEATANSGKIIPMKNTGGTATTSAAGYMASGSEIDMTTVTTTADFEFSIVPSTTVKDAVCIKVGDIYIGNTDTKNNCKLFAEEAETTSFGVSVGTNDVFTLKIAVNSSYHTLQYNTSSPRFAVYGGGQKNLVIYKKTSSETGGETKQSYAIIFASNNQGSCSATVDGQIVGNGDLVEEGKTVTVSCKPSAGYTFNAWNVYRTGNEHYYVTVSENNTFTMPAAAVTIDAYYLEDSTSGGTGTFNPTPVFDFVTHPTGWPSTSKEGLYKYTLEGYDYTFQLPAGSYCGGASQTSGYLMMPKSKALGLPAIPGYKLAKVVGTLNGSGSPSVKSEVSVTDGSMVVSGGKAQTWNEKGGQFTYNLNGTSAGTMYYLAVSSTANCQMSGLSLTYTPADPNEKVTATVEIDDMTVQVDEYVHPVFKTNIVGEYLVEYTSSNDEVVLAADDQLLACKEGSAIITAYIVADGYTDVTTTFTVTVTAAGSTGGLSPIPNFIKNAAVEIALNSEPYDVRLDLNIPKDANYDDYSITTSIGGKTEVEDTYACEYSEVTFKKAGTYVVHVVALEVAGKYAQTEGDITITVYDPNEPVVDPDEPASNVYATLAELVAAGKPSTTARKVTVTLTDEEITKIFVTSQGYRNGIFLQVGEQEIEIYSKNVPEAWLVGGTVSGTLTDCDWKLYSSTWELCPADWSELQYTAPTEVEVQQYAVTYTAPEHGTLVVKNGEEQLTSGAQVDNGTRVTLEITPDAGYEFEKWEAVEDGAVKYTCTSERRYYDVTKDVEFKAYFREAFVEPAGEKVTWDLSIDETTTASDTKLMWRNTIAMMEADKATSGTATNNYYPGTTGKEYTSTRFYTNSTLTVTPAKGITINAVVAECTTSDYTNKLVGSVWANATVKNFGTKVVITPTDGAKAVSAVLGGTTGATSVTVYYTGTSQGWPEVTTYDVNVDGKVVGGTISASAESAEAGTTITLTATPADGYEFTSWKVTLVDDDSAVTVKDNKFTMPEGDVNVSAAFTEVQGGGSDTDEHTLIAKDVWGTSGKSAAVLSGTQNDCTILCKKAPSSSQNCSYVVTNNAYDMRVYAGGIVTLFNLTGIYKVVFNISAQGLTRLATITSDSGTIAYDVENATVTWTATTPVKTVTFTVGEKADYGTDGATKAGQLDFTSFDVVEAAAQGEVRDVVKYIDGLDLEVETFSVEKLQTIINSALGK